jgi:hypothetical protein
MASGACLLAAYDAPLVRVRKALDEKEMPAAQGGQVPRAQGCAEAWLPLRHETTPGLTKRKVRLQDGGR